MYAGIDIGTSSVKTVLVDDEHRLVASAASPLSLSRPQPGWSEQEPEWWWNGVAETLDWLAANHREEIAGLKAIGLSGQMLGIVLIDRSNRPIRASMLWNDGRAGAECRILEQRVPDIAQRGCIDPDPGFGAPKLLWLARHEPDVVPRADCLLMPKDYVRLKLTGERASEPSDASGTLLFDNRLLAFAPDMVAAAAFALEKLPPLTRAWKVAGTLRGDLARRWGIARPVPVAAGAGDNLACKLGVGAALPGRGALTIGTSGVLCVSTPDFVPIPGRGVQTTPHAAPDQFSSQGVVMSATSALDWLAGLLGTSPDGLDSEAAALWFNPDRRSEAAAAPSLLPYFDGVRTPHRNALLRAAAGGMSLSTTRAMIAWSLFEGVALHFDEVRRIQLAHGIAADHLQLVGGGARSSIWPVMIASLFDAPLALSKGREHAAAIGAARLAMAAIQGGNPLDILAIVPEPDRVIEPDRALSAFLRERAENYDALQPCARLWLAADARPN